MKCISFALLLCLYGGMCVAQVESKEDFLQRRTVAVSVFEGIVVVGYVDGGGFLNFTGPNVSVNFGSNKIIVGMLPSLRFKEDTSTPKNSFVTPNLGVGITFCYKRLAIQIPLYYNVKTAIKNGEWSVGLGLGGRFFK